MEALQRLVFGLHKATQLHLSIVTEELSRIGITRPQILVLDQIKDGPKTIGKISQALSLSYSTVSGIVDRLERQQLVVRKRDEKDRRIVWVALADGACRKHVPFEQESYYREIFRDLTDEEIRMIGEALSLLCTCLAKKQETLWEERGERK